MLRDILENRFTAKWWDPTTVEAEKLEAVLRCAYLAPSKQGKYDHKIIVVTDTQEGQEIKDWLYWHHTWCFQGDRGKPGDGLRRYNGQVRAPILLLWAIERTDQITSYRENEYQRMRDDAIVSATMAMCAAEELGLQTGFNSCLDAEEVANYLGLGDRRVVLALGIGYATENIRVSREVYADAVSLERYPNGKAKHYGNAYELIRLNEDFIIEEAMSWLNFKLQQTGTVYTYDANKCRRDIRYVIAAYLHDLQYNSMAATKTIMSEYWYRGRPQVRRTAEGFIHEFIKDIIINNIITNTPVTTAYQSVFHQTFQSNLVAEEGVDEFIRSLALTLINCIKSGYALLPVRGFDYANVPTTIQTGENRKFRPPFEEMINYI